MQNPQKPIPRFAFHWIVAPAAGNVSSTSVSSECPLWCGPRKLGQSAAREDAATETSTKHIERTPRTTDRAELKPDFCKHCLLINATYPLPAGSRFVETSHR